MRDSVELMFALHWRSPDEGRVIVRVLDFLNWNFFSKAARPPVYELDP
jgi:hypothetical protein